MPDGIAITGRVQRPDGGPAAGAVVTCHLSPPSVSLRGAVAVGPGAVVLTANSSGVFGGQLVAGTYTLAVRWAGRNYTLAATVPGPVFAAPAAAAASDFVAAWRDSTGAPAPARLAFVQQGVRMVGGAIILPVPVTAEAGSDGALAVSLIPGSYSVEGQAQGARLRTFVTAAPGDWLAGGVPVGPVNSVAPAVTGNPFVGQTLTRTLGTWTGTGTISYATQWLRGGAAISGATGATYVQQAADAGQLITARVTATDSEGSRSATSAPVATSYPQPVAAGELADVTVDQGSGDWTVAAAADFTGVGLTYALQSGPAGTSVNAATGLVTGTSANLLSAASVVVRASTPDGKFADSGFSVTVQAVAPEPVAPVITGVPTISGTAQVGETLTATPASVTGNPSPTRTWQWYRSPSTAISGATAGTYTLVEVDEGETVFVRQIETNSEGSDSADSAATDVVQAVSIAPLSFAGDFISKSVVETSIADTQVNVAYRSQNQVSGFDRNDQLGFALVNSTGKSPEIRVSTTPDWRNRTSDDHWRLAYSYDPDTDAWSSFPTRSNQTGYVAFSGVEFTQSPVYIRKLPWFTFERMEAAIDGWVSNALTSPTPSGDENYLIGTLPARTDFYGRSLPAASVRAFKIGTGPRVMSLSGCIHPHEAPAFYGLHEAVNFLLSEDPQAVALRSAWTIYVYPNLNPQGLWGGYTTIDPATDLNANRDWSVGVPSDLKAVYISAWAEDLDGLLAVVDFHSSPTSGSGREVWRPSAAKFTTAWTAFLPQFTALGAAAWQNSNATDTVSQYLGAFPDAKLVVVSEHGHGRAFGPASWRKQGADILRAIEAITAAQFPVDDPEPEFTVTPSDTSILLENLPPLSNFVSATPAADSITINLEDV